MDCKDFFFITGDVTETKSLPVSVIRPTTSKPKRPRNNPLIDGSPSDSSPRSRPSRRKCHKPQRVPQTLENGVSPADSLNSGLSVQESTSAFSPDTDEVNGSMNDSNDVEIVAEVAPSPSQYVQPLMTMPLPFDFPIFNNIFFPSSAQQRIGMPLSPLAPFFFLPRMNPAQFDMNIAPEELVKINNSIS